MTTAPTSTTDTQAHGLVRTTNFDEARRNTHSGSSLVAIRKAVPAYKDAIKASGRPTRVRTCPLQSLPYPTQFGFFRARTPTTPFLTITNRMLVVQWSDAGRTKTLLWGPSDAELGVGTPFFAKLSKRAPSFLQSALYPSLGTVLSHLAALGIDPTEVDFLAFDHLHTQDIRRLVGTTRPQADISPGRSVPAWFPNAKMIVQRAELELMRDLHPLQAPWYQARTYDDVRPEAYLIVDGDYRVGPGVALLATPGHTPGNQSLVLHTATGLWTSSENVIAAECLTPEHSTIPGLTAWTRESGEELVMNGNTLETRAEQYNSTVLEKLVADPDAGDPRFLQFFPTSELTMTLMNPLARPTFVHGGITHG